MRVRSLLSDSERAFFARLERRFGLWKRYGFAIACAVLMAILLAGLYVRAQAVAMAVREATAELSVHDILGEPPFNAVLTGGQAIAHDRNSLACFLMIMVPVSIALVILIGGGAVGYVVSVWRTTVVLERAVESTPQRGAAGSVELPERRPPRPSRAWHCPWFSLTGAPIRSYRRRYKAYRFTPPRRKARRRRRIVLAALPFFLMFWLVLCPSLLIWRAVWAELPWHFPLTFFWGHYREHLTYYGIHLFFTDRIWLVLFGTATTILAVLPGLQQLRRTVRTGVLLAEMRRLDILLWRKHKSLHEPPAGYAQARR